MCLVEKELEKRDKGKKGKAVFKGKKSRKRDI